MKRCPECRRDYTDDTLSFCLEDGTPLVQGSVPAGSSGDEPATAILSESGDPAVVGTGFRGDEGKTRPQILTTDQTAILQTGAEAEPQGSSGEVSERQSLSGHRAAKPLVIVGIAVVLLIAGFFGYRYLAPTSKQIESIAVMPFVNESGNADVEYLSDGMTETLIGSLSQIPNLNVKARSSVFRYKGKEASAQTVGKELNVQAILNGRVVKRGDDLTLYVELVNTTTENVLWKAEYNRSMANLVSLQGEIARDVSSKLRTRLSNTDEQRVTKTYTANPEAYQLYLQGLYYWNKRTPEDIRKSIELFQNAIEKDPTYAQAYAGLALAYNVLATNSIMKQQEKKELGLKERVALGRAQGLDDTLAEVHVELAVSKYNEWDFAAAENEYKRAIELNPNFATVHQWYADFLGSMGRHEEAVIETNKAHEIDPFSRTIRAMIGKRFVEARHFDEGIAQYKKVIEMEPNYPNGHAFLRDAYEAKGLYPEAIAETRIASVLLERQSAESAEGEAAAFTEALKTAGAQGYQRKQLELRLKEYEQGYESAFGVAGIYAVLGDKDRAFEWLEKSFAIHADDLINLKIEPAFDGLSTDPRFQDLLRRVGLPQ